MGVAQLVVIHADISKGLLGEIETAGETVKPEGLLISFLAWQKQDAATREKLYETFRRRANPVLGGSLPAEVGAASFLRFNSRWDPVPVEVSLLKTLLCGGNAVAGIRETLRPHLREAGVRVRLRRALIYAARVLLVAFGVGWLIWGPAAAEGSEIGVFETILFFVLVVPILLLILRAVAHLILRSRLRRRASLAPG